MFQASASPAHRKVSTTMSRKLVGILMSTSTRHASNSKSSKIENLPRWGSAVRRQPAREGLVSAGMRISVIDTDGCRALLPEQPIGPEDHDQQKQNEKKQLPESRRDVIAAQRLDNANADAA